MLTTHLNTQRRVRRTTPTIRATAVAIAAMACVGNDAVTAPHGALDKNASAQVTPCSAELGQQLIESGDYQRAVRTFTCVIALDPTAIEGYRGRIEAQLMLGRFSDAVRDYTRVNAFVVPVHPDAGQVIVAGYAARLAASPTSVTALSGLGFAHWWFFNYPGAIQVLGDLLAIQPNSVYANLFRGSSRLLKGSQRAAGVADLEQAIMLAPFSPDVRFIVADAYTYGYVPDAQRAFNEATLALNGGLDTPRIRAIRGASYTAFGNVAAAALEIRTHIDMVTTELVTSPALSASSSLNLALVPGRTWEVPLPVTAGQAVSVATSSKDFWDTILVLIAPDGTTVLGSDDDKAYFAGFAWVAPATGTYRLRVTSFESVNTGQLSVARK